jgi:O-methyltransferase/methyltransferase family protein
MSVLDHVAFVSVLQKGDATMDTGDQRPSAALLDLVNGFRVSQAINVVAALGIADLLKNGPRSSGDLAAATGTHADTLYRLLRALASVGVFREEADRRFMLTSLSQCLRSDALEPVGPYAVHIGEPRLWQAWGHLLESVRTGENTFRLVHGVDAWEYRRRNPEAGAIFDRAMTGQSRLQANALLKAYDFERFRCVVDVGGGHGLLLSAILVKHRSLRGVLFDQPHVVSGAEPALQAAGVSDRCQIVGGDFFEAVPSGGDVHVLKLVLHDWQDAPATAILRCCRRSIAPTGRLLVIDAEIAPPNEGSMNKFLDLSMLVQYGARERTREEWAALFAASGFQLVGATPTEAGLSVIEGIPT